MLLFQDSHPATFSKMSHRALLKTGKHQNKDNSMIQRATSNNKQEQKQSSHQ